MTHRPDDTSQLVIESRAKERAVRESVQSLFRYCSRSDRPALAFSRACSKVGYLARDGVRGNLHHLESALNEQKHAIIMTHSGNQTAARGHTAACAQELVSFMRGVRRELLQPTPEPLPTPKLRDRIERNLQDGQWYRARLDLDDLVGRANPGGPLRSLADFPRSLMLQADRYDELQKRIDLCNSRDRVIASPATTKQHATNELPRPPGPQIAALESRAPVTRAHRMEAGLER